MGESFLVWAFAIVLSVGSLAIYVRRWARREAATRALREEARSLGTDRPETQHPIVDEIACVGCGACVDACPEGDVLGVVSGRAVILNGLACVGHGRCADACPVGALRVGLADAHLREDIPLLTEELETSMPGVFVAGELSGFSLIRNAIAQGTRVADTIADRLSGDGAATAADDLDVLVVGAGPAGLSAALRATERGLRVRVLDRQGAGGTILQYPRRKLVLTQPVEIPRVGRLDRPEYAKEELLSLWEGIPERCGLDVRSGDRVLAGEVLPGGGYELRTESGQRHRAQTLVLALGRRGTPRRLGVPGEEAAKVAYQLVDAGAFAGARCLVVGGGDSAVEAAIALSRQEGTRVTLSYRREHFVRIKRRNRERLEAAVSEGSLELALASQVVEIGSTSVRLLTAEKEVDLDNDAVFVFAGGEPPFALLRELGVRFGGVVEPARAAG
jgi:thioredoxin reductase/ferredoxin